MSVKEFGVEFIYEETSMTDYKAKFKIIHYVPAVSSLLYSRLFFNHFTIEDKNIF